MQVFIYEGHDLSRGAHLEQVDIVEPNQREDMPQDYVWRALGDHIGSGPSDVPQRVDALLLTRRGPIRARVDLSYVETDGHGDPLDTEEVPVRIARSYRPGLCEALKAAIAALLESDPGGHVSSEHVQRLEHLHGAFYPDTKAPRADQQPS